ncbi:MAG: hypothetical protein NVSMB51_21180 [Solirubrobacteraceae bacterium]
MSFGRVIWSDLIEKRLWPIALFLVLATIAVPLAIGAAGTQTPAPPPPGTPAPGQPPGLPDPGHALVAVAGPRAPVQGPLVNYEHNPFRKPYGPRAVGAAVSATTAAAGAAKGTTGATGRSGTSTAGTGKTVTAPVTPTATTPAPTHAGGGTNANPNAFGALDSYRVDLALADKAGVTSGALNDIVRFSPLPSALTPQLIFLGVLKGGKRVAFLVTGSVTTIRPSGAACLPSTTSCEIIEIAAGQKLGLSNPGSADPAKPDVSLIATVTIQGHSSVAAARRVRARTSAQGRALFDMADPGAQAALQYSVVDGALTEAPASVKPL